MGDRNSAVNFFNHAAKLRMAGPPVDQTAVYQGYSSAVVADPTLVEGWRTLANLHSEMGMLPACRVCGERVLQLTEKLEPTPEWITQRVKDLSDLGHLCHRMGDHKTALEYIDKAIGLDANAAMAWLNRSMIESVNGELDASLESSEKAFALAPDKAEVEMGLAFALLYKGRWAEGLKHYESRFQYAKSLKHFSTFPYPKWDGSEGKSIFLVPDQGMGDALSYARFIPLVAQRCKHIFLVLQPALVRLMRDSLFRYESITYIPDPPHSFPNADAWSSITGIPATLGLTDDEIINCPGLEIYRYSLPNNWKSTDRKLHIGIQWAGSQACDVDRWRSSELRHFLSLYRVPDIQLYSLQIGDRAKDIHIEGAATMARDLSPYIRDAADTVALLADLDLVISVDSALGHIAGAIGKTSWIAYSRNGCDHRIGRSERGSLWYPKTRIFKQGVDATWPPVFDRIANELKRWMSAGLAGRGAADEYQKELAARHPGGRP